MLLSRACGGASSAPRSLRHAAELEQEHPEHPHSPGAITPSWQAQISGCISLHLSQACAISANVLEVVRVCRGVINQAGIVMALRAKEPCPC